MPRAVRQNAIRHRAKKVARLWRRLRKRVTALEGGFSSAGTTPVSTSENAAIGCRKCTMPLQRTNHRLFAAVCG
jgi:hypothetical protein